MKPDIGQIWVLKKDPKVYYCLTERVSVTTTESVWRATPLGFGQNLYVNLYNKDLWDFIC